MTASRSVRYRARHGDRDAEIIVEAVDASLETYRVTVDGRAHTIEWATVPGRRAVSCLVDARRQYEVVTHREGPERRQVYLSAQTFTVDCVEALVAEARQSGAPAAAASGEELIAPIPGRVVEITCQAGQAVAPGTPLVILEAMKMQNELRSSTAGIVEKILCTVGDTVEGGAVLIVIGAGN